MSSELVALAQQRVSGDALNIFIVDSLPLGVLGWSLGTPGPPLPSSYYFGVCRRLSGVTIGTWAGSCSRAGALYRAVTPTESWRIWNRLYRPAGRYGTWSRKLNGRWFVVDAGSGVCDAAISAAQSRIAYFLGFLITLSKASTLSSMPGASPSRSRIDSMMLFRCFLGSGWRARFFATRVSCDREAMTKAKLP